jgi:hypothetical protein
MLMMSAATLGDTVGWNPSINPTEFFDCGTQFTCTTGLSVGMVVAVSGQWNFADGTASTISTTTPLVYFFRTSRVGAGALTGQMNSLAVLSLANPSGTPTGTPAASGGTVAAGANYMKVVAIDGAGNHTNVGTESALVTTVGVNDNSIVWAWTAVTNAAYYQVWVGAVSGSEANYFTSPTNSFTQTLPIASGTGGTLPSTNNTGTSTIPLLTIGGGTNVIYRCLTAGASLPAGSLTITSADCGTSTATNLTVN